MKFPPLEGIVDCQNMTTMRTVLLGGHRKRKPEKNYQANKGLKIVDLRVRMDWWRLILTLFPGLLFDNKIESGVMVACAALSIILILLLRSIASASVLTTVTLLEARSSLLVLDLAVVHSFDLYGRPLAFNDLVSLLTSRNGEGCLMTYISGSRLMHIESGSCSPVQFP